METHPATDPASGTASRPFRRISRIAAVLSLGGLIAAMVPLGAAASQEVLERGHACYEAKTQPIKARRVGLTDHLGGDCHAYNNIRVGEVARFCNPLNGLSKPNSGTHLTWYRIPRQPGRPLNKNVTVYNELTGLNGELLAGNHDAGETLTVLRPAFLTLPTVKLWVDSPGNIPNQQGHLESAPYVCYSVRGSDLKLDRYLHGQFQGADL